MAGQRGQMAIKFMFRFKKEKKKKNYGSYFFVAMALLDFVVLFCIFWSPLRIDRLLIGKEQSVDAFSADKENKDPFITKNPLAPANINEPVIRGDDPSTGARDARINLIMFSDLDCEFCDFQYKSVKNILGKYGSTVRLIWKDYPSSDQSSRSYLSAIAGRCAYEQGKFWQYRDLLSENSEASFESLAKKLNLNINDFSRCFSGEEAKRKIAESIAEADALGISGVPDTFVNGRELLGEISEEELERLIQLEILGGVK